MTTCARVKHMLLTMLNRIGLLPGAPATIRGIFNQKEKQDHTKQTSNHESKRYHKIIIF